MAIIASFSIGAYANQVKVLQTSAIGGNHVLVPAPELQIQNNFWRIDANQSLVTSVWLLVSTNGTGPVLNKVYQVVVQVSCLNAAGLAYTCSHGTGIIPLPTNTNGNSSIVRVPLTPPVDPETTEIDDLSYIVTGYAIPSSTPGVISLTPNGNPILNPNGTGTLRATLISINGFAGTVKLTAMSLDPGVRVGIVPPWPWTTNVTLTAGGSAQVTFSVDASNVGPGNYVVTTSLSCVTCPASGQVVLYSPFWWVNNWGPPCTVGITISATPSFVQLVTTGGVETVTKTVYSVCGFYGYVSLAFTEAPTILGTMPTVSISPSTTLFLSPGGTASFTETIASTSPLGSVAAPGTYTIVNTATSGSYSASTFVTVQVITL